jgi:hypothetical protein
MGGRACHIAAGGGVSKRLPARRGALSSAALAGQFDPAHVLALQRGSGNAAVGSLLRSAAGATTRRTLQRSLPTGPLARQPEDEADAGAADGGGGGGASAAQSGPPVFRTAKVWVHAFIPENVPGVTIPRPNHPGETMAPGLGVLGWVAGAKSASECYSGDSRDFSSEIHASYRMHSEVEIGTLDTTPSITLEWHDCGESHGIDQDTGEELESAKAPASGMAFSNLRGNATADPEGGTEVDPNQNLVQIDYDGAAAMPLLPSPDIDMNFTFQIDAHAGTIAFSGMVDEFPAYEIYAAVDNGAPQPLLELMPTSGKTPADLPGDADRPVSGSVSF